MAKLTEEAKNAIGTMRPAYVATASKTGKPNVSAKGSLRVIDGAVVIFSGVEGVEAQSEKVWRQADRYQVPRLAFINKLDRIGACFPRVIAEVNHKFGDCAVAIQAWFVPAFTHGDASSGT